MRKKPLLHPTRTTATVTAKTTTKTQAQTTSMKTSFNHQELFTAASAGTMTTGAHVHLYAHVPHHQATSSSFSASTASTAMEHSSSHGSLVPPPPTQLDTSFLRRLFSRSRLLPSSSSSPVSGTGTTTASTSRRGSDAESLVFAMTPSPHTHPLLSKPRARDEVWIRPLRKRAGTVGAAPSQAGAPRGFSEARRLASLAVATGQQSNQRGAAGGAGSLRHSRSDSSSSWSMSRRDGIDGQQPAETEMYGLDPATMHMAATATSGVDATGVSLYTKHLREREQTAVLAAVTPRYVQEWGFFIKCYAEGRFNFSNPPDPPPRRPGFDHFSAPAPPSETQRLKVSPSISPPLVPRAVCIYHRSGVVKGFWLKFPSVVRIGSQGVQHTVNNHSTRKV